MYNVSARCSGAMTRWTTALSSAQQTATLVGVAAAEQEDIRSPDQEPPTADQRRAGAPAGGTRMGT